jgi:hypothetical protein
MVEACSHPGAVVAELGPEDPLGEESLEGALLVRCRFTKS